MTEVVTLDACGWSVGEYGNRFHVTFHVNLGIRPFPLCKVAEKRYLYHNSVLNQINPSGMDYQALKNLVKRGEGSSLEFKLKTNHPEKIIRGVVAFANTNGGIMLIGVGDEKKSPVSNTPTKTSTCSFGPFINTASRASAIPSTGCRSATSARCW